MSLRISVHEWRQSHIESTLAELNGHFTSDEIEYKVENLVIHEWFPFSGFVLINIPEALSLNGQKLITWFYSILQHFTADTHTHILFNSMKTCTSIHLLL